MRYDSRSHIDGGDTSLLRVAVMAVCVFERNVALCKMISKFLTLCRCCVLNLVVKTNSDIKAVFCVLKNSGQEVQYCVKGSGNIRQTHKPRN